VEAPVVRQCVRCRCPLDAGRSVFCSQNCIEAEDSRAASLALHMASWSEELERQRAAVEADIAAYAERARWNLRNAEDNVAAAAAELEPLRAHLAAAKSAREIHWDLQSDRSVPQARPA
jgi:hypothetical protein